MAIQSVATANHEPAAGWTKHDLWIGNKAVLTVAMGRDCREFQPQREHCRSLNLMIQGLAQATKSLIYQAENDTSIETNFVIQPLEEIANAIILFSQLSEAVRAELDGKEVNA